MTARNTPGHRKKINSERTDPGEVGEIELPEFDGKNTLTRCVHALKKNSTSMTKKVPPYPAPPGPYGNTVHKDGSGRWSAGARTLLSPPTTYVLMYPMYLVQGREGGSVSISCFCVHQRAIFNESFRRTIWISGIFKFKNVMHK